MAFGSKSTGVVEIKAPKFEIIEVEIEGTAPYVQHAFPQKAREKMRAKQAAGEKAAKAKLAPRDFANDFKESRHYGSGGGETGWAGIPCAAFRKAMIDACRLTDVPMTKAKMAVFVIADGVDPQDGTSLVRLISQSEPQMLESMTRNDNGSADIRIRSMWPTWGAKLRIRYDAEIVTAQAVVNLLSRAGLQIGVGEGRPFSPNSAGMDWGTFIVKES
jgi:hypothetical protein